MGSSEASGFAFRPPPACTGHRTISPSGSLQRPRAQSRSLPGRASQSGPRLRRSGYTFCSLRSRAAQRPHLQQSGQRHGADVARQLERMFPGMNDLERAAED